MRGHRALSLLLLTTALGCASAASQKAPTPAPPVTQAPWASAIPAVPEPPDDPFRYMPPSVGAFAGWTMPTPKEVRLPNGLRGLSLEQGNVDYVEASIITFPPSSPPIPGLDDLLLETLLGGSSRSGSTSVREGLHALGITVTTHVHDSTLAVDLSGIGSSMGEGLRLVLRRLSEFAPTEADLGAARSRILSAFPSEAPKETNPQAAARTRMLQAVKTALLPKGHHARPIVVTNDTLAKIRLTDLTKWGARSLSPDQTSVLVAGAMTNEALRLALDDVATWKPKGPRRKAPKPVTAPRGVFLEQGLGGAKTEVGVVIPSLRATQDEPASAILTMQFHDGLVSFLNREVQDWGNAHAIPYWTPEIAWNDMAVTVSPEEVVKVVKGFLGVIDEVARGDLDEAHLERHKRSYLEWQESKWATSSSILGRLVLTAMNQEPLDSHARFYAETRKLTLADIRTTVSDLKRSDARVVISGAITRDRAELDKLGLGPVVSLELPSETP